MSSYQLSHGQDHVAFADDYNTHCILQLLSSDNNRKCLTLQAELHARPKQLL